MDKYKTSSNEFFVYKYETDVFNGIESMKTLKSRVPLHDYAYKQKIMKWARLEGIQPLLIDALPIYIKNVGNVSYEKLYFKLSKINPLMHKPAKTIRPPINNTKSDSKFHCVIKTVLGLLIR